MCISCWKEEGLLEWSYSKGLVRSSMNRVLVSMTDPEA